jgi:hypothetical protein
MEIRICRLPLQKLKKLTHNGEVLSDYHLKKLYRLNDVPLHFDTVLECLTLPVYENSNTITNFN